MNECRLELANAMNPTDGLVLRGKIHDGFHENHVIGLNQVDPKRKEKTG